MLDDGGFEAFALASDSLFAAVRSARGRVAEGSGMTLSQTRLLEPLAGGSPPMAVSRLAELAAVSVPTATRVLQTLERDGMVVRSRSASSGRVVEIALTDQGRHALQEQTARLRERQKRVWESLDPADRERVVPLVHTLIALTWEIYGVAPDEPDRSAP